MSQSNKMVLVSWVDAARYEGWFSDEETSKMEPKAIHSVGFLIRETPEYVALAASSTEDDHVGDVLTIPRGLISAIVHLRRGKVVDGE